MINFSFVYDGIKYNSNNLQIISKDSTSTTYILDNLKITRSYTFNKNNCIKTQLSFINISTVKSKIIEKIYDIDENYDFVAPSLEFGYSGYGNDEYLYIVKTKGSNYDSNEFSPIHEALRDNSLRTFSSIGGRSSQGYAPFFELRLQSKGILFAVGWTGQWHAKVKKSKNIVNVKAGIENTRFYLNPNESIQTSQIMVMPYNTGHIDAYNKFKNIIKQNSPLNKTELPFFSSFWGGASSDFMLKQLNSIAESKVGIECFWVDAGWYGDYSTHCYSEFSPEWGEQTGNWFVNEKIHPNQLNDVFNLATKHNLKKLLWLEPERAIKGTKIILQHPDWFLKINSDSNTFLLNLGNDDAREYFTNLISELITTYNLDFYRQDFNMDPLPYWNENSANDRQGILEIKHINGLYKMWDELLKTHPTLIIDNCASGGRRIDIQTLSRSVPLWRSDYQCVFDADAETAQNHGMSFSRLIPFSATGIGFNVLDKYKFRSCYASGLNSNFFGYELKAPKTISPILKDMILEFKKVRKYFSCDYYPIFGYTGDHSCWGGWQFNDAKEHEGIIMAFRRDLSPNNSAVVFLGGLKENTIYEFSGDYETFTKTSKELLSIGLQIIIDEKRNSKLIFYKAKSIS